MPLLLVPVLYQTASAQSENPAETVALFDTVRWTWSAQAGETKVVNCAANKGFYGVCWGDGDLTGYDIADSMAIIHRYKNKGEYEVMLFGIVITVITEDLGGGVTLKMRKVEGGTFSMGATSEQGSDAYNDEKPVHTVTLDGFYMGETEITQAQWRAVMGTNPSSFNKGDNYPVENVSWDEAVQFCEKLSQKTGRNYVLPTEAQWEYAARGGKYSKGTKYAGSNTINEVAWYTGNSNNTTHPVAQKEPNELGLYDMSGNVDEWCLDRYGSYSSSDATNPTGPGPSAGSARVERGGNWLEGARYCRVSYRYNYSPGYRGSYLGFRVVCLP